MSLYKTQRCRHFDEAGNPVKPYCSQGNKCRFIHPNDYQWDKLLKRKNDGTPSPASREAPRSKAKNRIPFPPASPTQRQHSSPLVPQSDLFKRKQKDSPREHDHQDWSIRNEDRRRDSDPRGYSRERNGSYEQGYSLKRPNDEGDPYPNHRPRLSERVSIAHGIASGGSSNHIRHTQADKIAYPVPDMSDRGAKSKSKVSDTFHLLAKLCCEIVQDTCFLDREEDKLKAFTGLSSELSRAVPDAAMAVTPALTTVITGRTRTRERLENHVEELERLWKMLFSMLEADISKIIDSRLEQVMALLDKEKEKALRAISHTPKPVYDRVYDGTTGPRQLIDGWKETTTDRTTALSGRSTISANGITPVTNVLPEEARRHEGPTSLPLIPTQEGDLGTSLRVVLEDMKTQMDRQTRAIELLAKENLQLKFASEHATPQLVPPDSASSASVKPPIV